MTKFNEIVNLLSSGKIFTATMLDGTKCLYNFDKNRKVSGNVVPVRPMNAKSVSNELDLNQVATIKYSGQVYNLGVANKKSESKRTGPVAVRNFPLDPRLSEILTDAEQEYFHSLKTKSQKMSYLLSRGADYHLIAAVVQVDYTAVNRQVRIDKGLALPNGKPKPTAVEQF